MRKVKIEFKLKTFHLVFVFVSNCINTYQIYIPIHIATEGMEGRVIEYRHHGGGLDYHNSPLIGEIPNHSEYMHRSIDQLRSLNERGALNIISNDDFRTGYKSFNNNTELRDHERVNFLTHHHKMSNEIVVNDGSGCDDGGMSAGRIGDNGVGGGGCNGRGNGGVGNENGSRGLIHEHGDKIEFKNVEKQELDDSFSGGSGSGGSTGGIAAAASSLSSSPHPPSASATDIDGHIKNSKKVGNTKKYHFFIDDYMGTGIMLFLLDIIDCDDDDDDSV